MSLNSYDDSKVVKSPLSYIGGKSRIAPRIIKLLPNDRGSYVEVFGGAGHILTQKPVEKLEVYNDIQGVVVNFFLIMREHTDELVKRVERMPVSREEHNRILDWWNKECPGPVTDIERAARWYYLLKTSFSSIVGNHFSYARTSRSSQSIPSKFHNASAKLEDLALRWRSVNIEKLDFENLITRYDAHDAVFYCDPPYVDCENYYSDSGFTNEDHTRLSNILNNIKGRVILSYYPHKLIDKLYSKKRGSGWRRIHINSYKSASVIHVNSPKKLPTSTELLILNFDPKKKSKKIRK